jgi:hypothetical protein
LYCIKCICSLTYWLQVQDISHLFVSTTSVRCDPQNTSVRRHNLMETVLSYSRDLPAVQRLTHTTWSSHLRCQPVLLDGWLSTLSKTFLRRHSASQARTLEAQGPYAKQQRRVTTNITQPGGPHTARGPGFGTPALHDGLRAF